MQIIQKDRFSNAYETIERFGIKRKKLLHYFSLKEGFKSFSVVLIAGSIILSNTLNVMLSGIERGGRKLIEAFSQKGKEKCSIDVYLLTVLV